MTEIALKFDVIIEYEKEHADELGKELAVFLEESFFNGEDVLNVKYVGHELNKK